MPSAGRTCEHCGRRFTVCKFNKHSQKYCKSDSCVRERKRKRQRKSYKQRYKSNQDFRRKERLRCAKAIALRRERSELVGPDPPSVERTINIVTGLLSQFIDTDDPRELALASRDYEIRGQRLALNSS